VVLVDTGPEPRSVTACLDDLGVTSIPMVVLSHFHLDHIGGLGGVLPYHPSHIVTTAWPEPPLGREAVRRAAAQARVPVVEAPPLAVWTVGQVTLRVLSTAALRGTRSDPNNNSLVLLGQIRGVGVLLLGDAETEQQRQLHATNPSFSVDVMKVAHHGSAYQEPALLEAVRPRLAVISVGAANGYGHPNPALLAWFHRQGTPVRRRDVDGAIRVSASAAALQVSPRCRWVGWHGSGGVVRQWSLLQTAVIDQWVKGVAGHLCGRSAVPVGHLADGR
jgi:competence protein ComEC